MIGALTDAGWFSSGSLLIDLCPSCRLPPESQHDLWHHLKYSRIWYMGEIYSRKVKNKWIILSADSTVTLFPMKQSFSVIFGCAIKYILSSRASGCDKIPGNNCNNQIKNDFFCVPWNGMSSPLGDIANLCRKVVAYNLKDCFKHVLDRIR